MFSLKCVTNVIFYFLPSKINLWNMTQFQCYAYLFHFLPLEKAISTLLGSTVIYDCRTYKYIFIKLGGGGNKSILLYNVQLQEKVVVSSCIHNNISALINILYNIQQFSLEPQLVSRSHINIPCYTTGCFWWANFK